MIEKKIHYVWFGNKKPEKVLNCINSWKKILPEYEIIEWNEKSFDVEREIKKNKFFRECYKRKLWAFVSDYIRVKILYEHGGIYLDTDIEIIKDITPLLNNDTELFLGYENSSVMSFGIVGVVPKHKVFKKFLEFYQEEIWHSPIYIVTGILTKILSEEYGNGNLTKNKIKVYPREYFYPFNHDEKFTKECITENTYAIHWWGKSWGKNPKVYFLKYKHLPFWKKYPKHFCKLINFYLKYLFQKNN